MRQRGRVRVSVELIGYRSEELSDSVICSFCKRCEWQFVLDGWQYIPDVDCVDIFLQCPEFDEVPETAIAPLYRCYFTERADGMSYEWKRA